MLKTLIGAACLAILAAVGYFFWGEYQTKLAANAAVSREQERAIAAVTCRKWLKQATTDGAFADLKDDELAKELKACDRRGLLTSVDLEAVLESRVASFFRKL